MARLHAFGPEWEADGLTALVLSLNHTLQHTGEKAALVLTRLANMERRQSACAPAGAFSMSRAFDACANLRKVSERWAYLEGAGGRDNLTGSTQVAPGPSNRHHDCGKAAEQGSPTRQCQHAARPPTSRNWCARRGGDRGLRPARTLSIAAGVS